MRLRIFLIVLLLSITANIYCVGSSSLYAYIFDADLKPYILLYYPQILSDIHFGEGVWGDCLIDRLKRAGVQANYKDLKALTEPCKTVMEVVAAIETLGSCT